MLFQATVSKRSQETTSVASELSMWERETAVDEPCGMKIGAASPEHEARDQSSKITYLAISRGQREVEGRLIRKIQRLVNTVESKDACGQERGRWVGGA